MLLVSFFFQYATSVMGMYACIVLGLKLTISVTLSFRNLAI